MAIKFFQSYVNMKNWTSELEKQALTLVFWKHAWNMISCPLLCNSGQLIEIFIITILTYPVSVRFCLKNDKTRRRSTKRSPNPSSKSRMTYVKQFHRWTSFSSHHFSWKRIEGPSKRSDRLKIRNCQRWWRTTQFTTSTI